MQSGRRHALRALRIGGPVRGAATLLHESRIPTDHFQDSLPKMPVPALSDTLSKFLYFAEPLVSDDEHLLARRGVSAFAGVEGPALQAELLASSERQYTSYISAPWFDMYLRDRAPLLLNYNPQLTFEDEAARPSQASRAARLCHAAGRFLLTLEAGVLEPDVFHTKPKVSQTPLWREAVRLMPRSVAFYGAAATGAYALDMSQYANLFRSTRLPRPELDELSTCSDSRHVVVQRGGAFWAVDLLTPAGEPVPPSQLQGAFETILASPADAGGGSAGVGHLTSLPRGEWAALREQLCAAAPANAASLKQIDEALFAVCLDGSSPEELGEVNRAMLHGRGIDRWLDKSFQLVVTENAKAAINFEHSWGDGVSVLRLANEMFDASTAMPTDTPAPPAAPPRRLDFELPPPLAAAVEEAGRRFDATIAGTDLATVMTDAFTTAALKKGGVSPDGMMQMSFQLAMAKMSGRTVSTYESASTAAFKHGRTETIRSATPESRAFTDAFTDPAATPSARAAAMRAAVRNHSRVSRDALIGAGMDRHLWVLQRMAAERGLAPPLFESEAYRRLSKIVISTSTLSSPALANGGFGPFHPDCFAVGYVIRADGCGGQIMTYQRDSAGFADCMVAAMREMRDVLHVDS